MTPSSSRSVPLPAISSPAFFPQASGRLGRISVAGWLESVREGMEINLLSPPRSPNHETCDPSRRLGRAVPSVTWGGREKRAALPGNLPCLCFPEGAIGSTGQNTPDPAPCSEDRTNVAAAKAARRLSLQYELRYTRAFILLAFSRSPLPGLPKDAFETRAEAWGSESHVPSRPCYPNLEPLADLRGDGKPGGALRLPGAVREPPCGGGGGGGEGAQPEPFASAVLLGPQIRGWAVSPSPGLCGGGA